MRAPDVTVSFSPLRVPIDLPLPSAPTGGELSERNAQALAQEFEALLLAQMLREMRRSMLPEEDDQEGLRLGHLTMTETIEVELARALSKAGGIGLAEIIQRGMTRGGTPGTAPPAQPVPAATESSSGPVASSRVAVAPAGGPATPITSGFGWRADPFHGLRRFHAGIDLRAAYGQAVPVAAPGRVVFAGEQGAYGLTVVVEHPGGIQTRYAHLSSLTVAAGENVFRGTVLGRVGQSGRATGPHLHFEVMINGRRVDPAQVASHLPALKPGQAADD